MARADSGVPSPTFVVGHDILRGLPHSTLARLLRNAKLSALRRGDRLFSRGDPGDSAFYIQKGIVKLSVSGPDGDQRIYALHGPGETVGEISMIDGLPRGTTAETLADCEFSVITKAAFDAELRAHPEIYPQVVTMLARRVRGIGEEVMLLAFLPMKARLARSLLRLAQLMGEHAGIDLLGVDHNIGQADIASMTGVTRESVSRTLADWKAAGIVNSSEKYRLILNVRKLAEEAMRHE